MADSENNGNLNDNGSSGEKKPETPVAKAAANSEVRPDKPGTSAPDKKPKKDKPSFKEKLVKFWRDYKSELKKIVWSPWKDVKRNTILVIVSVVVISAFIGALDFGFSKGIIALGKLI